MAEGARAESHALERLTAVSRALTYAVSLDEVLNISVDTARELLDAPRAVLMLQDDEGLLRIRAARGIEEDVIERFGEPLDETLVSRLTAVFGSPAEERFIGVPLVTRGRVTGLLAVLRQPDRDARRDEWLLSALADQTSVALEAAAGGRAGEDPGVDPVARVRELEAEGERRQRALQIMGHDTRSPLNSLRGYVHLLQSGRYGPVTDAQRGAFERIESITTHLDSLVGSALEMSRLAAGELSVDREPTPVAHVLEAARDLVELRAEQKNVTISIDAASGLTAMADAARLRQIMVQLLDNAIKYTPDDSDIRVAAAAEADDGGAGREWVVIRVTDQGPGIAPSEARSVFEPYRRMGDAEGFGLGLSIARGVVEIMGGSLVVEDGPGSGATLALRLERTPGP